MIQPYRSINTFKYFYIIEIIRPKLTTKGDYEGRIYTEGIGLPHEIKLYDILLTAFLRNQAKPININVFDFIVAFDYLLRNIIYHTYNIFIHYIHCTYFMLCAYV